MNVQIFNCYNQNLEQVTFSVSIANYKQILREQLTVEIKKKKVILSECNNKKGWKLVIQYEDKTRLKPDTLSQLRISKSNDGRDILLMNFSIGARLGSIPSKPEFKNVMLPPNPDLMNDWIFCHNHSHGACGGNKPNEALEPCDNKDSHRQRDASNHDANQHQDVDKHEDSNEHHESDEKDIGIKNPNELKENESKDVYKVCEAIGNRDFHREANQFNVKLLECIEMIDLKEQKTNEPTGFESEQKTNNPTSFEFEQKTNNPTSFEFEQKKSEQLNKKIDNFKSSGETNCLNSFEQIMAILYQANQNDSKFLFESSDKKHSLYIRSIVNPNWIVSSHEIGNPKKKDKIQLNFISVISVYYKLFNHQDNELSNYLTQIRHSFDVNWFKVEVIVFIELIKSLICSTKSILPVELRFEDISSELNSYSQSIAYGYLNCDTFINPNQGE